MELCLHDLIISNLKINFIMKFPPSLHQNLTLFLLSLALPLSSLFLLLSLLSTLFSTAGDYVLRAMPHLKVEYIEQAKTIETPFLGDPSFFAYNGEEEEEEEPDEDEDLPPRERFCEMHRLAFVVQVRLPL